MPAVQSAPVTGVVLALVAPVTSMALMGSE